MAKRRIVGDMRRHSSVALVGAFVFLARCGARSSLSERAAQVGDGASDAFVFDAPIDSPIDARDDQRSDGGLDAESRDADAAADDALLGDARPDGASDARDDSARDASADTDADAPFEIRDDTFLTADWTAEREALPFCSMEWQRFLGGNDPRSERTPDRGNPPSAWRLRTGPIALSAERCTQWVEARHQRSDSVSRRLCHYEISFDHRVESAGLWMNGAFSSPLPDSGSALFAVVAASSARVEGALFAGPSASSRAWASSRWRVTREQLAAAGVGVGFVVRFGFRAGNSTNVDQAGIGYFIDNTVDHFVVLRFIDPNGDGDCADATRG